MKKIRSNRIKNIILATIFTVCLGWGVLSSTMLSTVTATNKVSGNDIMHNYSQVPYEKPLNSLRTDSTTPVIDFRNDKKDAVDWSNENYPQISNIVKTNGEVNKVSSINNQLRTKYLNRAELYSPQEELTDLDNSFVTQAAQDITLYANLKTENFGINSIYFYYNSDRVFENMLKKTQYGSDDGYFLGDLTAQPLDSKKRESVQIKLIVPKGTGLIRVVGENESKYMIPRGNTFEYTEKKLDKTGAFPHVYITARLVDRDKLNDVVKEKQAIINNQLENKFNINPNLVKLVPLGLNAGNVISNSQEVATKPFTIMENNKILTNNMFDKATLTLTNGFTAHTEVFDRMTNGLSPEERRVKFEQSINDSLEQNEVGMTTKWNSDKTSTVVVGFSQLSSKDTLPDVSYNDGISATILHEFFHFLIFSNDNYKDRPMFNGDSGAFENKIDVLKTKEENKLATLLNNPYAKEDWEEYISEAFLAKNHPQTSIQTKFQEDIVLTNRFLDNIFDFESPSIPNGLAALDIQSESVKLTFNHSSDDVSVDKYNIYQNSRLITTIDTKKDNNGLSYANPGDYQENIVINIDGLAQMTEYEFQVSAVDEAKNESEKSTPLKIKTKDTEPPELGGNLKGSALGSTLARFNWPRPTDNVGVSEVKIRRIESSSVFGFKVSPKVETSFTVPGDVNFFTDFTIEKGKTYTYSMTALDAAGNESERSNNVVIQTSDDDDKKQNKDKAKNTSSSSSTLNWSGSFNGVSASGFQIFVWTKGIAGWLFGGVTSVAGTVTSSIVSLTPGMAHQFVVIPVDSEGNPINEGLQISVDSIDRSSIQTKDSELYVGQIWDKAANFVSATDEDGKAVAFDDERILTNEDSVDTTKPGVYELKYSFKGVVKTTNSMFTVTVKEDKTKLELQDVELYVGQKFDPDLPFKNVTDRDGDKLKAEDFSHYYIYPVGEQVGDKWLTKELDTSVVGTYRVRLYYWGNGTYSDEATITVKEDKTKLELQDVELYVGQKFDPDLPFKNVTDRDGDKLKAEDFSHYYIYPVGEQVGDKWLTKELDTSVVGTYRVRLYYWGNGTYSDEATITVKEDKTAVELQDVYLYVGQTYNPDSPFKNVTDKEGKALKAADIDWYYIDEVKTKSLDTSKPDSHDIRIVYLDGGGKWKYSTTHKLVIKENKSSIQTKDSELYAGQVWNKADNFVSATDEEGKVVPFEDARITTNEASVNTTIPGVYELKYSFKGVAKTTDSVFTVTVKEDKSSIQTKDVTIFVGQNWKQEDNFVSATDEDGKAIPFEDTRITTNESSVDTTKPGVYNLKYSFKGVVKTTDSMFTVTVKEEESSLHFLTYTGFTGFTNDFNPGVHIFNEKTKMLDFQDGVNLINPGIHIFTTNQLRGIQSNGAEVVLDEQQASGGGMVFNITYKTQINNYKDYTRFRINVEYYDTLWHSTRKAEASFIIK